MSDPGDPPPAPEPTPSWALIDAELARLAASALFRRSPRHLRFLRHLVQCSLNGEAARLREVVLGVEVFLRPAARFDPRQDSIVRVEAESLCVHGDTEGAVAIASRVRAALTDAGLLAEP